MGKKERKKKLEDLNKVMDRIKDLVEKGKWDDASDELKKARKLKYEFIELLPDVLDTPFIDWYKELTLMDRLLDHLIERIVDKEEKAAKEIIDDVESGKKKLKGFLGIE